MEDKKKMSDEEILEDIHDFLSGDDEPLDSDVKPQDIDFIPLDSLLYENDESTFDAVSSDQGDGFESFFTEYRALIAETLIAAQKIKAKDDEISGAKSIEEQIIKASEPLIQEEPLLTTKKQKSAIKSVSSYEDEDSITLKPQEYEQHEEQEKIFCEPPVLEEKVDLLLGSDKVENDEEETDEAQISFFPELKTKKFDNEVSDNVDTKYDPENPRKIDVVFDFLELFIYTLVVVMILTTFIFKHSVVDGNSMNNTLSHGDHLIVWDAFYTPERYDIIVFEDYSTSLKEAVVKRVIGLPGETVEIKKSDSEELLVFINGKLIEEEYAYYDLRYSSQNIGSWTLGENEIFVMGDNRYVSKDSRDQSVGPINIDTVLGKVVLRFFPFDKFEFFN